MSPPARILEAIKCDYLQFILIVPLNLQTLSNVQINFSGEFLVDIRWICLNGMAFAFTLSLFLYTVALSIKAHSQLPLFGSHKRILIGFFQKRYMHRKNIHFIRNIFVRSKIKKIMVPNVTWKFHQLFKPNIK